MIFHARRCRSQEVSRTRRDVLGHNHDEKVELILALCLFHTCPDPCHNPEGIGSLLVEASGRGLDLDHIVHIAPVRLGLDTHGPCHRAPVDVTRIDPGQIEMHVRQELEEEI